MFKRNKLYLWISLVICLTSCSRNKNIKLPTLQEKYIYKEYENKTINLDVDLNILAECIFINHKYNFKYYEILAVIDAESEFKVKARSKLNCKGLMQVSQYALKDYNDFHKNKIYDLYNIENNLEVGFWYLDRIRTKLNTDDFHEIYVAYNVGLSYYKKHKEELLNGIYKGDKYNALNRYLEKEKKYKELLNGN